MVRAVTGACDTQRNAKFNDIRRAGRRSASVRMLNANRGMLETETGRKNSVNGLLSGRAVLPLCSSARLCAFFEIFFVSQVGKPSQSSKAARVLKFVESG